MGKVPRLRMFAGPNGSGKSTLQSLLPPHWLGVYINPDAIERDIRDAGHLDLALYQIEPTPDELFAFLRDSPLVERAGLLSDINTLIFDGARLHFPGVAVNSYHASALADFLRQQLLRTSRSFTFETVMSSRSKLDLLRKSRVLGYRNYLYYIATESPTLNVSRVRNRVLDGGHDVPEEKVRSRYFRSLELLRECIGLTDRAYIFDNSGRRKEQVLVAEITDGSEIAIRAQSVPVWFERYVLSGQ